MSQSIYYITKYYKVDFSITITKILLKLLKFLKVAFCINLVISSVVATYSLVSREALAVMLQFLVCSRLLNTSVK